MRNRTPSAALLLATVCLIAALASPRGAEAAATITVINLDGPGEGFNDPSAADPASAAGGNPGATLGQQRLFAFQRAADIWGRFVNSSVTIRVGANFDPLPCDALGAVLGAAGPNNADFNFTGALVPNTWYPIALANALFGSDLDTRPSPDGDDIGATFNSDIGTVCPFPNVWYYGLDADPTAGTIDFLTVVLHELGHGLGFLTFVDLPSGAKLLGLDDTYMLNLEDHTSGLLYPAMTNPQRVAASISGELHWVGPEVVAAGVGLATGRDVPTGHVDIYAPNPQRTGSSVSHYSTTLGPNELMEPFFTGVDHGPGLARDLMADIGWSTAAGDTVADLGGDRTSDILWRKGSNGNTVAWLMNGFEKAPGSIGAPPAVWKVRGLGDFDGIGKSDILWRNALNGNTVVWQMNGFDRITAPTIGAPPVAWGIAGLGDFDGDGTSDILWRNGITNATVVWRMLALARTSSATIGAPNSDWQVVGVGDFDGDGTSDILWRNSANNNTVIWRMLALAKNSEVSLGAPGSEWQVVGVGDFDGDGTSDILWRNSSNNNTVIWRIVALARDSQGSIGSPAASWQVACVGDYDSNAADILWRNTSTNSTVIWQMNGFVRLAVGDLGALNADWQVRCGPQ